MENTTSKLLQIRANLYILLAATTGILWITVASNWDKADEEAKENVAICGTVAVNEANPLVHQGKNLFLVNCASCHNKNMKENLTGPALHGGSERWSAYPRKDLYEWIRRSQTMIKKGHPRAMELWRDWKPVIMNDFTSLTDEDIEAILYYVETQSASVYLKTEVKK